MVRWLVLVLSALNVLYGGWVWLVGAAPTSRQESERLTRQVRPQAIELLTQSSAVSTGGAADGAPTPSAAPRLPEAAESSAGGAPPQCLVAGPFTEKQATAVHAAVSQALQTGDWVLERVPQAPRWIVYMGRYPDQDTLARKKAELRVRRIAFEAVLNPALEPGLSLGSYPSQAAAFGALSALADRGVRTARVLQDQPDTRELQLRLPAVDQAMQAKLAPLAPRLAGRSFRPC